MASSKTRIRGRDQSALRAVADRFVEALHVRDAVDGATKAADESGLPQGEGGPADAYRHLLIVGELKRRFGPSFGTALAGAYEYLNDREGQSQLARISHRWVRLDASGRNCGRGRARVPGERPGLGVRRIGGAAGVRRMLDGAGRRARWGAAGSERRVDERR